MHDPDSKATFYQVLARQRRIRFMEENIDGLAVAGAFLSYVILYFGLWQIGSLSVRYVKGNPTEQPPVPESSKT